MSIVWNEVLVLCPDFTKKNDRQLDQKRTSIESVKNRQINTVYQSSRKHKKEELKMLAIELYDLLKIIRIYFFHIRKLLFQIN